MAKWQNVFLSFSYFPEIYVIIFIIFKLSAEIGSKKKLTVHANFKYIIL